MPWLRAGTVALTTNSQTVTGTNADFVTNVRVGDAFIGPDGRSYEVSNVASATVLAIVPAYQGASVSNAAYSIMPVQGYQKDLADQVRAIVNAYGAKLAALGTTGNYDVLPVGKGGTGGTSASTAQNALGLVPMAHPTDATPGKLIGVGSWGIGAPIVLNNPGLNDFIAFGYYYVNFGLGTPAGYISGWLFVLPINTDYVVQDFVAEADGSRHSRTKLAGKWQPWNRIAVSDATGTITASKLAAAAMVGTVSQSAGVPTGAIIESGSNASGSYTKFADGTLICIIKNAGPFPVAANAVTIIGPFALPVAFSTADFFCCATAIPNISNDDYGVLSAYPNTQTSMSFVYRNGQNTQSVVNIKVLCIGRWF